MSGLGTSGRATANDHMLAFAAMMIGQSALAMAHVRAAQALMPPEYSKENPATADYFTLLPLEVMVRFGAERTPYLGICALALGLAAVGALFREWWLTGSALGLCLIQILNLASKPLVRSGKGRRTLLDMTSCGSLHP